MKIKQAGFLQTTLLDYPGEISSVIFLPGCNLTCPYCHNPSIVYSDQDSMVSIDYILDVIYKRKNIIGGVVLNGGEPTLYEDLQKYIDLFHSWNLKVKLDTNGTNPNLLKSLKPDYIAMDLKTSLEKYPAIGFKGKDEILESLIWIKESGIEYEIRTTAAPIIFNKDDLMSMIPLLKGVENYYITNFKNGITLNSDYNLNAPYSQEELNEFEKICRDAGINCTLR